VIFINLISSNLKQVLWRIQDGYSRRDKYP
jgi:hypothetical protein